MSSADTKDCAKCGKQFSLEDFLTDPHLEPVGIASDYSDPRQCHLYFCHTEPDCMTTLTIPVEFFLPNIEELVPEENLYSAPGCPRHCTTVADLRTCTCKCAIAPYRRFMLRLIKMRERQLA